MTWITDASLLLPGKALVEIFSMMMTSKATLPPTRHLSAYKYFTSHTQSKHDHKYEFFVL